MCGIVGYWDKRGADATMVEQMALRIQHRDPDDAGVWLNQSENLAMGASLPCYYRPVTDRASANDIPLWPFYPSV